MTIDDYIDFWRPYFDENEEDEVRISVHNEAAAFKFQSVEFGVLLQLLEDRPSRIRGTVAQRTEEDIQQVFLLFELLPEADLVRVRDDDEAASSLPGSAASLAQSEERVTLFIR